MWGGFRGGVDRPVQHRAVGSVACTYWAAGLRKEVFALRTRLKRSTCQTISQINQRRHNAKNMPYKSTRSGSRGKISGNTMPASKLPTNNTHMTLSVVEGGTLGGCGSAEAWRKT